MSSSNADEFHTLLLGGKSLSMMEESSCRLLLLLLLVLSELFQACLSGVLSSHTTDKDAECGGCDDTGPQMPEDSDLKVPESPRRSDALRLTVAASDPDF